MYLFTVNTRDCKDSMIAIKSTSEIISLRAHKAYVYSLPYMTRINNFIKVRFSTTRQTVLYQKKKLSSFLRISCF